MMASVAACSSHRTLGYTLQPELCAGKRSSIVSVCVSSSRAGITGSSVAQLHVNNFSSHHRCGRQLSDHVTSCIAAPSEDVAADEEETGQKDVSPLKPTTFEVHQLLMELCDETSIAELQLKVGAFRMKVKRDVGKVKSASVPPPVAPPPVPSKPMVDSLPANNSAPTPPKASAASGLISTLSKPLSSTWALLESAADEGLLFVKSPKVGYFRKGRVAKGKSGPPLLEEGQVIKEGHVVCYLEQLGTQQPVESEISGEVVKVLWDDGEPVGYGDPLIAIRPSFPGIKMLQ